MGKHCYTCVHGIDGDRGCRNPTTDVVRWMKENRRMGYAFYGLRAIGEEASDCPGWSDTPPPPPPPAPALTLADYRRIGMIIAAIAVGVLVAAAAI